VAGHVTTQLAPGSSGDVPSFASFQTDAAGNVMAAAGTVGGGGFRAGALPVILLATDIGFAYQPNGETSVTGVGGVTLPVNALTGTSRPTTPFNSGAGLQETITGLNALGGLVIGLGTNTQANVDPRQGLEALSKLTGAVNRSTTTIANGTADPIAPGDPLYFQIASGFAASVADGITTAIQNAVTNVAVDITIKASDPRVRIVNHTGVLSGIGSGQTATFDIEFVGDGVPHRFDLLFVRNGTDVVLGSIPVVIGTPIPGDCYDFEELEDGEISSDVDFGSRVVTTTTTAPTVSVTGGTFTYDATTHTATAAATGTGGVAVSGTFGFTYNGSATSPTNAGTYAVVATFTSSDPSYSDATGIGTLTINSASPTVAVTGGTFTYDGATHTASATATGIGGAAVGGTFAFTYNGETTVPLDAGSYAVTATFTSSNPNYDNGTATGTVVIGKATPAFSNLNLPVISQGTVTNSVTGRIAADTVVPAGGTVTGTLDGVTQSATVDGSGNFLLTFATGGLAAGSYPVSVSYAGGTNFDASTGATALTVNAVTGTITATGLDISGVAGAPLMRTVATFTNTLGTASYAASISWGDGSTSEGVITGTGATLAVVGAHTYAAPGSYTIRVMIVDTQALGQSATTTSTATVTALDVAAGKTHASKYWNKHAGPNLIRSFNGGAAHTELATWLATNFGNLYGASAGVNNLSGKSNADVATYFQNLRHADHGAATQLLTTALNVYATTASLGGEQGAAAGFRVSATGHGAKSFNVRKYGAAVEVANNTKLNVYQLLLAVNNQTQYGILYAGDSVLQRQAKELFSKLNSI